MNIKTFLYVLKNFLAQKYPHIEFEFYLSRRTKNVHMGLSCSLLELCEHNHVIHDIEELWLRRTQDMNFRFVLPQLIHTVKWRFDYLILRPVKKHEQ